jgi:nickel-dependent lactate racemase
VDYNPGVRPDLEAAVRSVDLRAWKTTTLEFGSETIELSVPPETEVLSMPTAAVLSDPGAAIEQALARPVAGPALGTIVREKRTAAVDLTAAIAVSDITRPVPYKGRGGLLPPLLKALREAGVRRENITLIVGTGTHRPSTAEEKAAMFGDEIARTYRVIDHDGQDYGSLTHVGRTARGTEVHVNTAFVKADVKVATGLVESHFMAGVSGGRKAVCPALVDVRTIQKFHGPDFLESPLADNLILEGNPCHEEALEVAKTVGVDFTVNVTLDRDMRLTGAFAGDLEAAHRRAYEFMKGYTAIPLEREYDIVLTHGGYSGRNHYQTAKAGCAAVRAVKPGGAVVIAADNRDREPVGSPEYRELLGRLKTLGVEGYVEMIRDPGWTFTKDQWEPEVWGRVLRKVGEEGLVYCAPRVAAAEFVRLPGRPGWDFDDGPPDRSDAETARTMVQNALRFLVAREREKGTPASVAVLREGPYGIPCPGFRPAVSKL